ncbi:MAG: hypothetical protein V5A45_04625 [Haloarculaceae archaeon]
MAETHPIDGQVVLQAGAFASVPLQTLSELIGRVQRHIDEHHTAYERQFECIESSTRHYYLTPPSHWEGVAEELGLTDREVDAVRRAHETQFRRDGRRLERSEEFETALQIRSPVVVTPQ